MELEARRETYFEKVSAYADEDLVIPIRKTPFSAGYDIAAAEDIVVPPQAEHLSTLQSILGEEDENKPIDLNRLAALTKATKAKPTLIPTGYKCRLLPNQYLKLVIRSSSPLKYWLVLANSEGIIDSDQYNNADNEGHIYFQVINLSPFPIQIKKGDIIGQGIVQTYTTLDIDPIENNVRSGGFGSTTNDASGT